MPQPLSNVLRKAKIKGEINVSATALTRRPQFTPQIMEVIAHLAHIDGDWGTIFSGLLKSDIVVGTAAYQAFNGLDARRRALLAVAEKALRKWQFIALQAVWNQTNAARSARDKFAHHVWGTVDELPDALLLMDSNVIVDMNMSYRQRAETTPDGGGVIRPEDFDRSKIFVYRKPDFDAAVKEAREAAWMVRLSYSAIGPRTWGHEVGRRQLLNEPRFQQAVAKLIPENDPEVQAQLRPPTDGSPPPTGTWD